MRETTLRSAARQHARVVVHEEMQSSFIAGAEWLADGLYRILQEMVMENTLDKGTQKYLNDLRVKDFWEALAAVKPKPEETDAPRAQSLKDESNG